MNAHLSVTNKPSLQRCVAPGYQFLRMSYWIVILLAGASSNLAQTFLFDFGASGTPTIHADAPNDPAKYWNNVPDSIGASATGQLLKLVTANNITSDINLVIVKRFNGANESGANDSTLFPLNATRDSLYGNTEIWNNATDVFPRFKLTGLDTTAVYNFQFYASRAGVGDIRETVYTLEGATTETTALDASNNIDNTATAPGLKPSAAGEITISLSPSANNNNAYHFTYLGAMKVEAVPPQTPLSFTTQPASQRATVFQSVTFTAAVAGAAPYTVQWYQNGAEIPEATGFSYTIPSVTADLDGAAFSVSVSNLVYGVRSTNAVLRVVTDATAPLLLDANSPGGLTAQLEFSEALDPATAIEASYYTANGAPVAGAVLRADGKGVFLTFAAPVTGDFTVTVHSVTDLAGNAVASGTSKSGIVPALEPESFLFDFGGGNTTQTSFPPDDPAYFWNNVGGSIGASDTGELLNLVTSRNRTTEVGLVMLARFNGANENGTLASPLFPSDATRDSLYGNTEAFNSLTDIFPSFKLTGLDPSLPYRFVFYASRAGVSDNRETGYTVAGASTHFAALNAANNVTNTAVLNGVIPASNGEVAISLAPTAQNNNANHFTYLGVMKVLQIAEQPLFLSPVVTGSRIKLQWTGDGKLEWASALVGPWTAVAPAPASPYTEDLAPGERFFRLKQ